MNKQEASKLSKLDATNLENVLKSYADLIRTTLESQSKKRFQLVAQISTLADKLLTLDRPRANDFDFTDEGDDMLGDNVMGGVNVVRGRRFIGGGDQMDLTRTLIDTLMPLVKSNQDRLTNDVRRARADELKSLLEVKDMMKNRMCDKKEFVEIDTRIEAIKKELNNAVVPTDILRGHSPEAEPGQQEGNGHLLGTSDGNGVESPH